jgi:hypothetical protein
VGHVLRSSNLLRVEASRLGFPSLASRLVETRHGWCTWYHHGGYVDVKLKTDESMRRTASDPATLA